MRIWQNRNILTVEEVYNYYKKRFDIEHFFKFAKSKMRFDKLQTINPEIDEDYCMFIMLAYNHLYHLKNHAIAGKKYDWHPKKLTNSTPSDIYVSLSEIKHNFQNITDSTIIRGIPNEKNIRTSFEKKEYSPVIIKSILKNNNAIIIKVLFGKSIKITKTVLNANNINKKTLSKKILVIFDEISEIIASKSLQLG